MTDKQVLQTQLAEMGQSMSAMDAKLRELKQNPLDLRKQAEREALADKKRDLENQMKLLRSSIAKLPDPPPLVKRAKATIPQMQPKQPPMPKAADALPKPLMKALAELHRTGKLDIPTLQLLTVAPHVLWDNVEPLEVALSCASGEVVQVQAEIYSKIAHATMDKNYLTRLHDLFLAGSDEERDLVGERYVRALYALGETDAAHSTRMKLSDPKLKYELGLWGAIITKSAELALAVDEERHPLEDDHRIIALYHCVDKLQDAGLLKRADDAFDAYTSHDEDRLDQLRGFRARALAALGYFPEARRELASASGTRALFACTIASRSRDRTDIEVALRLVQLEDIDRATKAGWAGKELGIAGTSVDQILGLARHLSDLHVAIGLLSGYALATKSPQALATAFTMADAMSQPAKTFLGSIVVRALCQQDRVDEARELARRLVMPTGRCKAFLAIYRAVNNEPEDINDDF